MIDSPLEAVGKKENMSFRAWTTGGYGFYTDTLWPRADKQIDFIKKYLPDVYSDMMSDEKDSNIDASNTAEHIDFCRDWIDDYNGDGGYGFFALFVQAIQEQEKGFEPGYFQGEDEEAVMYPAGMPWDMTEREKAMSEEDMTAIFRKYLTELGVSPQIEWVEVGFCD